MKPTLYYDDRSPPVRSCLLLIKILDIDVELKFVDLFKGAQLKPEYLEINPAHSVPVLQHNGLTLTDSHAILIYLCETFEGGNEWWPDDKLQRIEVINKLFLECSFLFRRDSDMMSEIVRNGFDNIDLPYHERKILEVYRALERNLSVNGYQYMAGNKAGRVPVSGGDMGTPPHVGSQCLRLDYEAVPQGIPVSTVDLMFQITAEKWPRLFEWFEGMRQSLATQYEECNQSGLEKLRSVVEVMGKFKFPERGNK